MRVLVTGGSGFIGEQIVKKLIERGEEVVATGRNGARLHNRLGAGVTGVVWDATSGPLPAEALEGVDAVINLAGEPVDRGRWSARKKRAIRDSRVLGTRAMVEAMRAAPGEPGEPGKPGVLVQGSAIGWYGDRLHNWVTETSPPATDFMGEVCVEWEAEAAKAREAGIRTAIVRTGVALAKGGGAYPKMSRPFRFGFGGQIGLGRAWMSWIHRDDLVALFLPCLDSDKANGVYNGVSPHPVSNQEFTRTLAGVLRAPALAIVPPQMLRLLYGEFAKLITASIKVRPLRTLALGFEFTYPDLRDALMQIEGKPGVAQPLEPAPPPEPEAGPEAETEEEEKAAT